MLKYSIQTIELSAASKAITFNSIPQTFDDLLIVYSTRSDRASNVDDPVNIVFNGSSSGYSSRGLVGSGSTAYSESYGTSVVFAGYMPAASTTANTFGSGSVLVSNYRSSSSKAVSVDFVSENSATTAYQNLGASLWTNSAAVTSVTISAQISNLVAGSSASLYGIRRGSDGRTEVASGGVITQSGGYTIHTFNSSGTFVANRNLNVEYLVVGGGGGGGGKSISTNSYAGAGGGAGGYRTSVGTSGRNSSPESFLALTAATNYAVIIGAGGSGGAPGRGANGSNSVFAEITSIGGGGGGQGSLTPNVDTGGSGGSGGSGTNNAAGGSGTANQGFDGIASSNQTGSSAGGAGAGGAPLQVTSPVGGAGGSGIASTITGTSVSRAGGGGGGGYNSGNAGGAGVAGGGAGGSSPATNGTAGTANTGGGGGGGGSSENAGTTSSGGAGGSGVVIIRYLTPA